MNCDEVELSLPEKAEDAAVRAHLLECVACSETAAVLSLAAQSPLGAAEKAKLSSLPLAAQSQWARLSRRREAARKFIGLAVAASLGAVIASGVMWKLKPVVQARAEPQVLVVMDDSAPPMTDEELTFDEVSWPSLNEEGDVL